MDWIWRLSVKGEWVVPGLLTGSVCLMAVSVEAGTRERRCVWLKGRKPCWAWNLLVG